MTGSPSAILDVTFYSVQLLPGAQLCDGLPQNRPFHDEGKHDGAAGDGVNTYIVLSMIKCTVEAPMLDNTVAHTHAPQLI